MLASLADAPLDDPQLVYEPKYDGIRAIVEIVPEGVLIPGRLGNEKTRRPGSRPRGGPEPRLRRRRCSTAKSSRSTPAASSSGRTT
jgi:hypothetical protein